jgi:RNA polymerase sigma factor (sigma-70 family)
MPASTQRLLRHIHQLTSAPVADMASDALLLERFVRTRDEAAFAALVRRHGPMVLQLCRRLVGDAHEAEDCFQAAFLVLARRAADIHPPEALAGWLYGVARRVALKSRSLRARRPAPVVSQNQTAPHADPFDALTAREFLEVLDVELLRLPEVYRLPVLYCCFEGLSLEEAARRLGWSSGSLKGRLQRGRQRLHDRLVKRGLALSAALALLGVSRTVAAVPRTLATETARAALAGAAGESGAVSTGVLTLANGAAGRVRSALAFLFLVSTVALGAGTVMHSAPPPQNAEASKPAVNAGSEQPGSKGRDRFGDPLPDGAVARLGTVRFNHGDGLKNLFFAPDGKTVVSEGNATVRLWDADSGKERGHFSTDRVFADDAAVLTPDGKTLLTLHQEGPKDVARYWDLAGGKKIRDVPLPVRRKVFSVYHLNALSPDALLAVIHTPEYVKVFELDTAKELWKLPQPGDSVKAHVFAGKDLLVTVDKKQVVRVWEARTGKAVREFAHGSPGEFFAASSDGRRLAVLERRFRPHKLPSGRTLSLHDRDAIHLWDLSDGTRKHILEAPPGQWHVHIQFSPSGKYLFASGSEDDVADPYVVTVWDAEAGKQSRELRGAGGRALAVSPDGTRLVVGGEGKFSLRDLKTGRDLSAEESRHSLTESFRLSPTGDRIWTFGYAALNEWDGKTGRHLSSSAVPSYSYADMERSKFLSPDGRLAVIFQLNEGRQELGVWDVRAQKMVHTLRPPGEPVYAPPEIRNATREFFPPQVGGTFSADSAVFATWHSGEDPVIRLWDLQAGKELCSFKARKMSWTGRMFFSAEGKTLLVAGARVVGYGTASGKELFAWRPEPVAGPSQVMSVAVGKGAVQYEQITWRALAVSPDAGIVACILTGSGFYNESTKDRIVLYEGQTGKVIRRWGDSGMASRLGEFMAFSPDGRLLATSDNEVTHVWEVATGTKLHTFRGHLGGIRALSFSANGRRLATSSIDTTVVLWDLTLPPGKGVTASAGKPAEQQFADWWDALKSEDALRGYGAVWRFVDSSDAAVGFLRGRVKPATDTLVRAMEQHIAELDNASFAVRDKASQSLKKLGAVAAVALQRAHEKNPSLEVRRRIEQLLQDMRERPATGEALRLGRVLAALEYAGTPDARRLLRELADGADGAWLTQESRAALRRLSHIPVSTPPAK